MIKSYKQLQELFTKPEDTAARIAFGNPPNIPTFEEAKIIVYGVAFDDSSTFGKGSDKGPEAMRHVSARQVETYVADEEIDVYEKVKIFDLGDFIINKRLTDKERSELFDEETPEKNRGRLAAKLEDVLQQFDMLKDVTGYIRLQGKIPLMIGGEHTLSYWPLSAVAREKPVVVHFDAHRDAKMEYMGLRLCHTTPMYHFLNEHKGKGVDFVQIGIRQTDPDENDFANKIGVKTFYPRDISKNFKSVLKWVNNATKNRNVYVTFDIDALDICYTPCTGTPEPFGMTPEQVVAVLKAVDGSAKLIGADFVEVAVKNNDTREAVTATQILLRMLAREYVR